MTLSGEQLQQYARDTAASLADVTAGHPFTPHLVHGSHDLADDRPRERRS